MCAYDVHNYNAQHIDPPPYPPDHSSDVIYRREGGHSKTALHFQHSFLPYFISGYCLRTNVHAFTCHNVCKLVLQYCHNKTDNINDIILTFCKYISAKLLYRNQYRYRHTQIAIHLKVFYTAHCHYSEQNNFFCCRSMCFLEQSQYC